MSDEEAERAPAQNPATHFSGNIMNFELPKFNARQGKSPRSIKSIQEKV